MLKKETNEWLNVFLDKLESVDLMVDDWELNYIFEKILLMVYVKNEILEEKYCVDCL